MVSGFNNKIRSPHAGIPGVMVCALFAASVLFAANAQGSIIVPVSSAVDVEAFLDDLAYGATCGAGTAGATADGSSLPEQPFELDLAQRLAATLSPTGGTTSSTSNSSTGGTSGSGNTSIHSVSSVTLVDLDLVGWVQGEARFALPMPPGNDLLRPPQFV